MCQQNISIYRQRKARSSKLIVFCGIIRYNKKTADNACGDSAALSRIK
jgi:hypothetical protein